MKNIYLDYAATTPVDPEVFSAMKPYFSDKFGNPGSLHYAGQEAIAALDKSREIIARAIGADFREIIFTSSATEANNLALKGIVSSVKAEMGKVRIIISAIEHESILETARDLEKWGVEVIYLPFLRSGIIDLKKLRLSLNENTVLVSIMYANNETGVIQPIKEISKIISGFRSDAYPLLHVDASQAFQYLDCDVSGLGVDLMTLSAHKIYGPKGAAALYVKNKDLKKKNSLYPSLSGGGQEFGMRSGTENVPAIVGFAKAAEIAVAKREAESKRVKALRDRLLQGIKKIYPRAELNGDKIERLPNILSVYLPGVSAEELLIKLDMEGIAISTGSACRARALDSSHVLEAMSFKEPRTKNSLRFSLGRPTTKPELDKVLQIIKMTKKPKG